MYRGTNALKNVHQPKNNQIMDEKGILLADSCSILNRQKLLASRTLHRVNDIKPTALHNNSATSKLLIRHSAVNRYWKKM